jgi:hypothetical protein
MGGIKSSWSALNTSSSVFMGSYAYRSDFSSGGTGSNFMAYIPESLKEKPLAAA